jgi:hypothetical protein
MTQSAKERTAAFELTWSLTPKDHAVELEYAVQAFEELYVADRLWDYDKANRRVPDPYGVYRFVRDGSLRLVFAQAPLPPRALPRVIYQPLYSRIRAQETHRRTILIALPVDEYSALARDVDAPAVLEEVSRAVLVLAYRLRSSMDKDPTPPPFESAEQAGYIVYDPQLCISQMKVDKLPVKRRTGDIPRFLLPGELPEPQ